MKDRQDDFTKRHHQNRMTKLEKQLRDSDIWSLRARGFSVLEIAEQSGYSPAQVRSSLTRVADEYKVEAAAEIIKMELDRLDIMLVHAMSALEGEYVAWSNGRMMRDDDDAPVPDVGPVMKAIDTILKIMDRRSKYLGLDAPSKSEQSINVHTNPNQTDLAVMQLINDFKQSAASLTPAQLAAQNQPALPPATQITNTNTNTTANCPGDPHCRAGHRCELHRTIGHPYDDIKKLEQLMDENPGYDN